MYKIANWLVTNKILRRQNECTQQYRIDNGLLDNDHLEQYTA